MNWNGDLGPLALLQAYRANPFPLYTDMSRPAQYLPPSLPGFDYAAQFRAQQLAAQQAAQAAQRAALVNRDPFVSPDLNAGPGVGATDGQGDGVGGGGGGGGGAK